MTILLDETTTVLVQGITGPMGRFQAAEMLAYGTRVVGGVSPGKGGERVEGLPVFDTMRRAVGETGAEMSILYVAAARAKDAIYEAIDAGIRRVVCVAEFMPVHDVIEVRRKVRDTGTRLIGPNCSGLISPGKAKVGFYCDEVCIPGDVGVMSKSGTLSYATLLEMRRKGIGASTVVGVGGDEVKGTTFGDCLEMFEADPATRAMLIIGEVGGREEEDAAAVVAARIAKPVVAFVSGRTIPPGRSIGHAGAMVVGSRGTHAGKVAALAAAGVRVAETIEDIPTLLRTQP
ncbi:MAG: succinate--CoA ligase subunit alpha [Alphaproteobacteria bacterium]|nr:succinate--CoA ligase subunit alpha [Alphaproteobacteria bacterium]